MGLVLERYGLKLGSSGLDHLVFLDLDHLVFLDLDAWFFLDMDQWFFWICGS